MARWAPGTAERLQKAALELFIEHGYDQVTAAQIAEAGGATERTFFRYFADKREVLFYGQDAYVQAFVDGINEAPSGAEPLTIMRSAVQTVATLFPEERRDDARIRQGIIDSHPALQERERHKRAVLAARIGELLRERGLPTVTATLVAESTVTAFGLAFTQWVDIHSGPTLSELADEVVDAFGAFVTGSAADLS